MPNAQYERGMRWEVRAKLDLERLGYWVVQTRGSRGVADMVGIKARRPAVLAQIKSPGRRLAGHEWNALYELALLLGAVPLYCEWSERPAVPVWYRLADWHDIRSRLWPSERWLNSSSNGGLNSASCAELSPTLSTIGDGQIPEPDGLIHGIHISGDAGRKSSGGDIHSDSRAQRPKGPAVVRSLPIESEITRADEANAFVSYPSVPLSEVRRRVAQIKSATIEEAEANDD